MKLKIEHIDEDTGVKVVIKNENYVVYYHNSDVHDEDEFEKLTDMVFSGNDVEMKLINNFYELAREIFLN